MKIRGLACSREQTGAGLPGSLLPGTYLRKKEKKSQLKASIKGRSFKEYRNRLTGIQNKLTVTKEGERGGKG